MTLLICCPLWWHLVLHWNCCILCWTSRVFLLPCSCNSGAHLPDPGKKKKQLLECCVATSLFFFPTPAHECCRSMCLPISDSGGRSNASMDAFRNPSFRGLFLFLLRGEAGTGKHMMFLPKILWVGMSVDDTMKATSNGVFAQTTTLVLFFHRWHNWPTEHAPWAVIGSCRLAKSYSVRPDRPDSAAHFLQHSHHSEENKWSGTLFSLSRAKAPFLLHKSHITPPNKYVPKSRANILQWWSGVNVFTRLLEPDILTANEKRLCNSWVASSWKELIVTIPKINFFGPIR